MPIRPSHRNCWVTSCKGYNLLMSFFTTSYPQLGWGVVRLPVNVGSGAASFLR
jgi:hypothetical protein